MYLRCHLFSSSLFVSKKKYYIKGKLKRYKKTQKEKKKKKKKKKKQKNFKRKSKIGMYKLAVVVTD